MTAVVAVEKCCKPCVRVPSRSVRDQPRSCTQLRSVRPLDGLPRELLVLRRAGLNRHGSGKCGGVTVYNPERMHGGVITWAEIADLFRPRV